LQIFSENHFSIFAKVACKNIRKLQKLEEEKNLQKRQNFSAKYKQRDHF
jgi:hypothetical protein